MGTIRAGGLASGLDTNAIIDELVKSAKAPIVQLDNQLYLKNLEKTLYKSVNTSLTDMRNSLFNLRMESVFKAKTSTASNPSAASVTVSNEAQVGTHTIEVVQTAKNSVMSSRYTRARIDKNIASGVTSMSGLPEFTEQLEGVYNIGFQRDTTNSKSLAVIEFESQDKRNFTKYTSTNTVQSSFVDQYGELGGIYAGGDLTLDVTINGVAKHISIPPYDAFTTDASNVQTPKDIYTVMHDLEAYINIALSEEFDTDVLQYVALRADYNAATGEWTTAFYKTSTENFQITGASGSIAQGMGIDGAGVFRTSQQNYITKVIVAANDTDLQAKVQGNNNVGIAPGLRLNFDATGLQTGGYLQIVQDASAKVQVPNKTSKVGVTAFNNTFTPFTLNGTTYSTVADCVDLSWSQLATNGVLKSSATMAGKFTINGKDIEITTAKAQSMTIRELIGTVNAAGAGVTLSLVEDGGEYKFVLQSTTEGASTITLSGYSNSSNFLSVMGFTGSGVQDLPGNSAGALDTDTTLANAGFSVAVSSGVIMINGVPIYINKDSDSVNDVIRKVNTSGANVTMAYDSARDKFTITSKDNQRVTYGGGDTSNFMLAIGFLHDTLMTGVGYNAISQGTKGQDSVIRVDGQEYVRASNTIEDVLPGISLQAHSVGVTVVQITGDTDRAIDALAAFIKEYNTLMKTLRPAQIDKEDRDNKMAALTDDDKAGMTADEIASYQKEYDELHTRDLILKSRAIKDLTKELRTNAMGVFINTSSIFKSMADMGIEIAGNGDISITQYGYLMTESNDLEVIKSALKDSSKFMDNLRNNIDEVYTFFADTKDEPVTDANGQVVKDKNNQTVTRAVYRGWSFVYQDLLGRYQDAYGAIGIKVMSNSAIDREIDRLTKDIANKQKRAEDYLERLWSQFSAMETRVSAINSQQQYIDKINAGTAGS